MTKAVEQGLPKLRIEEAAARRQARIDKGEDVIVGVNRFRLDDEAKVDILDIDNAKVRLSQIARLKKIRETRSKTDCDTALKNLERVASSGSGNLLEAAVDAARARATLGEISDAMERAFDRHKATTRVISGVYGDAYKGDSEYQLIQQKIADYRTEKQREVAAKAIDLDMDAIGVSSLAAGHRTLVPELIAELRAAGRDDIIVICGGVIPEQDYAFLKDAGVTAIFGPGTNVLDAANVVLSEIAGLKRNR